MQNDKRIYLKYSERPVQRVSRTSGQDLYCLMFIHSVLGTKTESALVKDLGVI